MSYEIHLTERHLYKACRRHWRYNYIEHLQPKSQSRGALWLGLGVHHALAKYYAEGLNPVDEFQTWFDNQLSPTEWSSMVEYDREELDKALELGRAMLKGYIPFAEANDSWEVIAVEDPITLTIPGTDVTLISTIDLLVRRGGKLWVVDHKTAAALVDPEALEFDDQMFGYLWAVWQKYGEKPAGAIYNQLIKKIPVKPELLKNGKALSRSLISTTREMYLEAIHEHGFNEMEYLDQLERYSREGNAFFKREVIAHNTRELDYFTTQIQSEALEMQKAYLGEVPIYPNPTRDCVWACSYRSLCRAESGGGDLEALKEGLFVIAEGRV